jgi:3-oxoacyl-[acyl-carrier protein] reductase
MDLQLTDNVAIVTGASRGIGKAIAETLAGEGVKVVSVARSLSAAPDHESVDLRDPGAASGIVARTIERHGRLDILVNNAGATQRGDFLTLTEELWQDGFALKFFGAMRLAREAWPYLVASGGVIVNISGVGGRTGSAEFAIGGAVNAALLNLTKVLADRGIKEGVRVCAINPGSIATERLQVRVKKIAADEGVAPEDAAARMAKSLGVARFGEPAEIGRMVAFLASPQAGYCQGTIVDVDGGATRTL